ncbi:hypothetical protein HLVA_21450 (plasmid) [Haliovirga abyssi]|uniref:Uncharacterized protein n=1 Tax=Haliovirga abyssi TaxID=2996794 RepID=A0AAU9DDI4_9FUSO|nr:hypothetical protein HLVA_21450 [Haliovirga abyssi]
MDLKNKGYTKYKKIGLTFISGIIEYKIRKSTLFLKASFMKKRIIWIYKCLY